MEIERWTLRFCRWPKVSRSVWSNCETVFDYVAKTAEIGSIETRMGAPGFWDNSETAQEVVGQLKSLKSIVSPLEEVLTSAEDLQALIEMAEEDESLEAEVSSEIERLDKLVDELETKSLLSGPNDGSSAIMTINARDGGTDANDWAEMLLRMYSQWAQRRDYTIELLDRNDNDEAGINSATIAIRGPLAYGYLKGETGIHRFVRISPFNAEGKRQTSFAAVDCIPEFEDDIDVEIKDDDIKMDFYRASGAGGQHVNKVSSAVRITHIPTGIVVQCQNERSQHKNRAQAMKVLKARLYMLEKQKRDDKVAKIYSDKGEIAWGSQIRSYVMQPYQMVKDHRTDFQTGNVTAVLDGDLDGFIESYLRYRAKNKNKE